MGIYAITSFAMCAAVERDGELLAGLGARLRFLRNRNGWTLEQLSLRTNLSEPFLSRLESGRRQPSLAALITLARTYSIPLAELLEETSSSPPLVVIRAGSSSEHFANGLRYRVVSGNAPESNLHAIHVTVPPRREHEAFYHHDGEEWLFVLSGQLRLIFENAEHLLKPGDSAHFEASTPHRLAAIGERGAEAVIVSCAAPQQSDLMAASKHGALRIPFGKTNRRDRLTAITDHDKSMTRPKGPR
jgi:transcriptional regulator with XRE-family HTH domain